MIFLLVYLVLYVPLVLGRARLQELNGGPGHVNRHGLYMFLAVMPLGFINPGLWLAALGVIGLYQARSFLRELRYRNRYVQFQRGNRPTPPAPLRGAA